MRHRDTIMSSLFQRIRAVRKHPGARESSAFFALLMLVWILVRPLSHGRSLALQILEAFVAFVGLSLARLCMESVHKDFSALWARIRRSPGSPEFVILAILVIAVPWSAFELPPTSSLTSLVAATTLSIAVLMGLAAIRCWVDPFARWFCGSVAAFWSMVFFAGLTMYLLDPATGITIGLFRAGTWSFLVAAGLAFGLFASVIGGLIIGRRRSCQAVPTLIAALKDTRKRVRRRATTTLGNIAEFKTGLAELNRLGAFRRLMFGGTVEPSTQTAVPALQELLQDKDAATRREAVWALRQIGDVGPAVPA